MAQGLNIFRIDTTGDLALQAETETLDLAKLQVARLMNSKPADYVIPNKATGCRVLVPAEHSRGSATLS